MAVESGYVPYKRRVKNSSGNYNTISHWTSSNTVEMDDGTTLEDKVATLSQAEEVTQAQYDALPASKNTDGVVRYITDADTVGDASAIDYDNTTSGLSATDVQDAIDEVDGNVDSIDSALGNTSISSIGDGTVTGAISTLNSRTTLESVTLTGSQYWSGSLPSSYSYKFGRIVVLYIIGTSSDTPVPVGGYHNVGHTSEPPLDVTSVQFTTASGYKIVIRVETSGDIVIYNYESSAANISGGGFIITYISAT